MRPRIAVLLCFSFVLPIAIAQSEKPTSPGPLVARVGDTGFVQVRAESFDKLTPQQKALAYWLTQASIAIDRSFTINSRALACARNGSSRKSWPTPLESIRRFSLA